MTDRDENSAGSSIERGKQIEDAARRLFEAQEPQAECRGCGVKLRGKPYHMGGGGGAYRLDTGARCKVNYYGGYVCSRRCDHRSSLSLEQSMPGHGYSSSPSLDRYAQESLDSNWPEN